MSIQRVEVGQLHCWADSVRYLGPHLHDLGLLSMFGPRNAVRAAWAKIFAKRSWPGVRVGEERIYRREDTPYVTVQTPMPRRSLHILILHASATRQTGAFDSFFLQVGPKPEERFFDRLTRDCEVPMRPEWRSAIWEIGLAGELIESLPGFGLPLYRVQTETDPWAAKIKEAIEEGRLA